MALGECKECGKEVSKKAGSCPHCGVDNPTTDLSSSCLIAFVILIGAGLFCAYFGSGTDSSSWKDQPNKIEAHTMIQGFVEDRLKAPSTAEFPSTWDGYDPEENIEYLGEQTYRINSYVDSENSFGATIRTNFTAEIKQVSEDEWQLIELNMD